MRASRSMRRHAEDAWPSFETRRWRAAPQDEIRDEERVRRHASSKSEIPDHRDDARFPHFVFGFFGPRM